MVTKGPWLGGITFRPPLGRSFQHFYVVSEAPHAEAARECGLSRARTPAERVLRSGLDVESATTVEARELRRDDLCVWTLADRETTPGEAAAA